MKTKYKIQIAKIISFFLKFFYKKNQIHIKNKIKWCLDLNEGIDLSIFLFGTSEKKIDNLKKLLKSNKKLTMIDIGANIGSISLPLAKIFNKSKIFAIEPTNYAFKKLTKNLNLNKYLKKNISLNQLFLSKISKPRKVWSSWNFDNDDLTLFNKLTEILKNPYQINKDDLEFMSSAPHSDVKYQTFCGT